MHLLIDEKTADRLVSGSVAPDDAPPGYARLASLVRAAQTHGSVEELVGEGAVAAMAAAIVSNTLIPAAVPTSKAAPNSKRKTMLSKVLTAKAAAAATVALFGLGTAAAAATGALTTGGTSSQGTTASLSISTTQNGTQTDSQSGSGVSTPGSGVTPASTSGSASGITALMTGPANQNAFFGLCTAFLAGRPATTGTTATSGSTATSGTAAPHGGKYNSTAFQALITEAGGSIASTTSDCTTYLQNASTSSTSSSDSTSTDTPDGDTQPSGSATLPGSGRPSSPGHSGSHGSHGHH